MTMLLSPEALTLSSTEISANNTSHCDYSLTSPGCNYPYNLVNSYVKDNGIKVSSNVVLLAYDHLRLFAVKGTDAEKTNSSGAFIENGAHYKKTNNSHLKIQQQKQEDFDRNLRNEFRSEEFKFIL
ncbi:uncharacterized protein LOC126686369 [Mercurialis annua]|uniref:uncharacterized protein LOC126664557 n=1 Tax=Mercurialis annua TaxID=3986 RepID=UPI0021605F79|nr:uncharacterized protein LOC126664557 [Mercurialis annua]XP_050236365.1 uncharacterized protein LOC126686369 [Mercurialis annua]